jgi:crotonobetainyl-CoA:carnitine CoA-transferase CaiB-like acyl-CoA transferase
MSEDIPKASPFSDLRVLELANFLAGPICGMFLADLGAEVLKVERPGIGDEMRYWGENKNGVGLYYKVINRGKKSITLDLRTPFGVEAIKRLVGDADVVIENYRPGTLEKWGLGYDVLSAINPKIILVRISGFGQTGPYRERPGFGTLAEAYSGYAHITGMPDGPPLLPGFGLADSSTGLMAAFLTAAAVHESRNSGKGQVVDLAIYETLFSMLGPQVVNYDQLGIVQERNGSRLPFTAPRNTYRTRDGRWISIAGSAQSTFERICTALEITHVSADARFKDNRARLANIEALEKELQSATARLDYADMAERFARLDATMAPVNNVAAFLDDEHAIARQNVVAVDDVELGGPVRMQNVVGRLSRTPGNITGAGPMLGEHNCEILLEKLGYSQTELAAEGILVSMPLEKTFRPS